MIANNDLNELKTNNKICIDNHTKNVSELIATTKATQPAQRKIKGAKQKQNQVHNITISLDKPVITSNKFIKPPSDQKHKSK